MTSRKKWSLVTAGLGLVCLCLCAFAFFSPQAQFKRAVKKIVTLSYTLPHAAHTQPDTEAWLQEKTGRYFTETGVDTFYDYNFIKSAGLWILKENNFSAQVKDFQFHDAVKDRISFTFTYLIHAGETSKTLTLSGKAQHTKNGKINLIKLEDASAVALRDAADALDTVVSP